MNHSPIHSATKALAVIVILALLALALFWWFKSQSERRLAEQPMSAQVTNTPHQDGVLVPPAGFPSDIPYDKGTLTTSAKTDLLGRRTTQYSISFNTGKTMAEEVEIYRSYLNQSGFNVDETDRDNLTSLYATKAGVVFNVVVSTNESGTLVQLSYLSYGQ